MADKKCDEYVSDLAEYLKGKFPSKSALRARTHSYEAREDAAQEVLDTFRGDPEFIERMIPLVDMEQPDNDWARLSAVRSAWYCIGQGLGTAAENQNTLAGVFA